MSFTAIDLLLVEILILVTIITHFKFNISAFEWLRSCGSSGLLRGCLFG